MLDATTKGFQAPSLAYWFIFLALGPHIVSFIYFIETSKVVILVDSLVSLFVIVVVALLFKYWLEKHPFFVC